MNAFVAVVAILVGSTDAGAAPPATQVPSHETPVVSATPALDEARRYGLEIARGVVDGLSRRSDLSPGLAAFVEDFRRFPETQRAAPGESGTRVTEIDALVSRNPTFWQATYEVAPADPAWLSLHAFLLLGGAEVYRAQQIAALAHLPGPAPEPYDRALGSVVHTSQQVLVEGRLLVDQGIASFDAGKRAKARSAYDRAIAAWPQNAFAHYEIGLYHLTEAILGPRKRKERKEHEKVAAATLAKGESPWHATGAEEAFARARRHDPLQWMAYQGSGDIIPRAKAMLGSVQPAWEKLEASSFRKLDDADLLKLAESLQEAQADELALVARQILVLRRGGFAPEDHPFITTSLRRLAPGPTTEAVLTRLAGEQLSLVRLADPWPVVSR